MRFFNIFLSATGLLIIQSVAYATDCTNPQGPGPVITCAAAVFNMTAEDFWNKKLFHPTTLDGFCVKNALPAGSSTSQATMYNTLACPNERGSYFSYNKFIAADAAILAAVGANNYKFMRSNSYALNLTELANFLATAAQETTGNGILPKSYEQDGLYFRYEDSFLSGTSCYNYPANPNWTGTGQTIGTGCSTLALANYYTNYYPLSTYIVAVKDGLPTQMYTAFSVDNDAQYNYTNPAIAVSFPGKPTLIGGTYVAPVGYHWEYMNQMLTQGYWIGQGNLQLTNVSVAQFFGWYEQNMAPGHPVVDADFNAFVTGYLGDGLLAWEGGLWYWNFRINGYNRPTLHDVLTGPKDACHDIALTTYLVNGGCNNYQERTWYYKYFKADVFKQSDSGVPYTYNGEPSNSMVCSKNLGAYCLAP